MSQNNKKQRKGKLKKLCKLCRILMTYDDYFVIMKNNPILGIVF